MSTLAGCSLLRGDDFGKIGDGGKFAQQFRQQRQPIAADLFLIGHHHHAIEKFIHFRPQLGNPLQGFTISSNLFVSLGFLGGALRGAVQFAFRFFLK